MLFFFYIFYTVPLAFATSLVSPESLNRLIPVLYDWLLDKGINVSGLLTAAILSLFFAFCPIIFKVRRNYLITRTIASFLSYASQVPFYYAGNREQLFGGC